jgi:hypothetical protein
MMKSLNKIFSAGMVVLVTASIMTSCKKDGNPNGLPSVSTSDYAGKVDGYDSSDQVYAQNLIAYWSFDDTKAERRSGIVPTQSANDAFVGNAVRGKALSLNAGYLYFAQQFPQFKTDTLKSWSMSVWVKILNNGSKRTMLFQMARPGLFTGNINFHLNTQSFAATNTDVLRIQPTFATVGGGTQDNINNVLTPKIGMDKWTHIVLTYDFATGVFDIWADAVKVGGFPNRGVGNSSFKAYEPSEVIIGSNYNGIPGKAVNTDVSIAPMTGHIDELRVYNTKLPDAFIKALNNLGKANK